MILKNHTIGAHDRIIPAILIIYTRHDRDHDGDHDGDHHPPVAPEPVSYLLFIAGGAVLAGQRYFKRKK